MKKSPLTIVTAAVLGILLFFLLFTFQVRRTEVAVVTLFGKHLDTKGTPRLYWRLPPPIEKVYKFDNRLQTFEKKFEETTTSDGRPILLTVYIGWKVADARKFLERFGGENIPAAEQNIEHLVRQNKNGVIGKHPFGDLISVNPQDLKFDLIEQEMLAAIKKQAEEDYGINVSLLGIKQIGLPESVTGKVFDRMKAERQRLATQFTAEGEAEAQKIRAEADRKRDEVLAQAEGKATEIRGQAEAEAAKSFAVFEQNPDLAIFILKLRTMEQSLKERTTLILDQQTPPFDMLNGQSADMPAVGGKKK
ncbi:MAG: protease modulator HflC [Pedosphaera parvula]|nr:protease modulator HflC [Pedosphaera parvula]